MTTTPKPLPKSAAGRTWVRVWRKLYNRLGFQNGYNFPLFVILAGAMMGFTLARLQYLNINGTFLLRTIPGDAVRYVRGTKRIGIIIHLACILPASFLVCFQFVPVIRHKALLVHRLNGYVLILLLLLSNAGAYIITPTAAGGNPATQTGMGVIASLTTISIILAYINIKRLRIDLHRAWMLRTWVYAGSIISLRLIAFAGAHYIGTHQDNVYYYDVQNCEHIWSQYALFGVNVTDPKRNPVPFLYPQCTTPNASMRVTVRANPYSGQPEGLTATMNILFGMALWLALAVHAAGVELYLWLTPRESERLRIVSQERRAEAGAEKSDLQDKTAYRPAHQGDHIAG